MGVPNPRKLSPKEVLRLFEYNENAQKILAHVSKSTTIKELMMKIGADKNIVWYYLRRFEDQGLAQHIGKKKKIFTLTTVGYQYLERIRPKIWQLL